MKKFLAGLFAICLTVAAVGCCGGACSIQEKGCNCENCNCEDCKCTDGECVCPKD